MSHEMGNLKWLSDLHGKAAKADRLEFELQSLRTALAESQGRELGLRRAIEEVLEVCLPSLLGSLAVDTLQLALSSTSTPDVAGLIQALEDLRTGIYHTSRVTTIAENALKKYRGQS